MFERGRSNGTIGISTILMNLSFAPDDGLRLI
jgi:hypothetical protein